MNIDLSIDELTLLIQHLKSGRVEFTPVAPVLVKMENARDVAIYGEPLVQRNSYVGGPTALRISRD